VFLSGKSVLPNIAGKYYSSFCIANYCVEVGLGKAYAVRVSSQNNTEVHAIPKKLLSLSAEDVHVLGPQKSNLYKAGASVSADASAAGAGASASGANAAKDWSSIESYVMSLSMLKTWGYPIPCPPDVAAASSVNNSTATSPLELDSIHITATDMALDDADARGASPTKRSAEDSHVSGIKERSHREGDEGWQQSPMKRKKRSGSSEYKDREASSSLTSSGADELRGVRTGQACMPTRAEATQIDISANNTSVLCGSQVLPNFVSTLSLQSTQYKQLWTDAAHDKLTKSSKNAQIVAVDCEMCETSAGMEVTRLTLVDQHSRVLLDTYVVPDEPIIDYKTEWSGISEETLEHVTITYKQAIIAFLRLVTSETILVGHSLDSDLKSLRVCHMCCVDTAILFPHPKGFPYRRKLKVLAETYLKVQIQRTSAPGQNASSSKPHQQGHDSVEDARAAMRLVNLKVEKGPAYGVNKQALGGTGGDDEFRQPVTAFADINELCLLSGSLFLWSGVENEKMMRCCVGIDSLGAVIPTSSSTSGDLDKCIDILGNYLSKHTLRIDKNLLAPLAVENLAIAEATGAAPYQLQGQLAASVEQDLQTNEEDDEDDVEAIAMTADHIFQQQLDETKHKDEVFSTSVLGELGIAGVKLCYFEFNAETIVDNSSPGLALRDAILRLQLRLAAESQQQTSASTVASDESTDPVENTDEREMAVDTTEKSTPTATATRISAVGNTLLIITTQANTETARKLSKRRLAAQNVRSTAVWTKDMEQELRQAYAKSNIAHASFKIL
jgi:DNA polymerase III epsilon subunit-like protein